MTGAADDDPSGIGTHSQVGALFGYGLAWTFVLSFPLMVVIQQVGESNSRPSRTRAQDRGRSIPTAAKPALILAQVFTMRI